MPGYDIDGVNTHKKQMDFGGRFTLFKTIVVSLLLHVAVIYLIPAVDILSPIPQYIEIETILLEPEIPEPSDVQSFDDQGEQETAPSDQQQESVTPLSEYEPVAPEMVSEQSRRNMWEFEAVQPSFRLPEPLAIEPVRMENQKFEAKSVEPESLEAALLPAREISRIPPEAVTSKTDRFEAQNQEVVIRAEQPYSRQEDQSAPLGGQEDILPTMKTSSSSEMIENAPQPSLSVSASVQPRLTRPAEPVAAAFNTQQLPPETTAIPFSVEKEFPDVLPAESVTRIESPDIKEDAESTIVTTSQYLDPEFRPDYSLALPKSQSQELLPVSQPLVKSARPPSSLPYIESSHPSTLSKTETKMIVEAKSFPATGDEHVVKQPETVKRTITTLSENLDPEFRLDYSLVLPTSQSQELLPVSQPLVKSVRPPSSLSYIEPSHSNMLPELSKTETTMSDAMKFFPATGDEQVVKPADTLELPPVGTMTVERDIASPPPMQSLLHSAGMSEQASSPLNLSPRIRKTSGIETPVEVRKVVLAHQDKALVQEETHSPKMIPVFQPLSSLQAPLFVIHRKQEERPKSSDEENMLIAFSKTRAVTLVSSQKAPEYSYPAAALIPHTQQVLNPQNVLVSAVLAPLLSPKKMITTLEDTFLAKKMAVDTVQYVSEAKSPLSERLPGGQPSRQAQSETLHRPPKLASRPDDTPGSTPVRSPSFKPVQRAMVLGGRVELGSFAKPVSAGIFVKKETPVPNILPQQKLVQAADVVTHITPQKFEEDSLSLVIEGPASRRQVISKPLRLPEVELDVEVTIRLKFWVLPDGSVGEVIPLQRGDVRLERAAIQYLKSWRFTPLSSGNQTVWGIIPITYKLR